MSHSLDNDLERRIRELEAQDQLREPRVAVPEGVLRLCSNDYLGFADEPLRAPGDLPSGAGASRLISGDHGAHHHAERAIGEWLGMPAVLLFSSGYAANVGVIAALAQRGDVIISDALNHASIIDGCRLARAEVRIVDHLDLASVQRALEAPCSGRKWVVTESYFSMDGNGPDLGALRESCDRAGAALVVDEAHALGVFGPRGAGLCHRAGIRPDVLIGTLSKAVGLMGAFVAGSSLLRTWLWNRARSFVFSTGPSPWLAGAAAQRIPQVIDADDRRARLEAIGDRLRRALAEADAPIAPSHGPILPWIVGDNRDALELSRRLLDDGVFVQAIRPPTVPEGRARLRITLSAKLDDRQLDHALEALKRCLL